MWILETEQKQKENLLADKQKLAAELNDTNLLLIVSRNYRKRLEKENTDLQSRKEQRTTRYAL